SGARYPPPMCLPGTREAILRDLNQWANIGAESNYSAARPNSAAEQDNPSVRWLYGPAGTGKSAIAQTFAETCAKNGTLLGSFFFWRSDSKRNNAQMLFTTLAMQMVMAIPELRAIVDRTVACNPFAPTSSIGKQCETLIIQPWSRAQAHQELNNWKNQKKHSRYVLIIDGLDECSNDHNEWSCILSALAQTLQKLSLPIKLLVCSRPEPCIKECFQGSEFKNGCQWMPLDNIYEANKDIRVFLLDGFQKILARHLHSMAHVPHPWPTPTQIEHLLQKSSGQFIYASTVLKY
ncbi:hypothetical protein GYMLUDRAFT_991642, partial [Collybiopsis luxurians FD-317 M1]